MDCAVGNRTCVRVTDREATAPTGAMDAVNASVLQGNGSVSTWTGSTSEMVGLPEFYPDTSHGRIGWH